MFVEPAKAIEERAQAILEPDYVVLYENVMLNPENGVITLRLTDLGENVTLIAGTISAGLKRAIGNHVVEVFTPYGNGKRENDVVCNAVYNCFNNYSIGNFKIIGINKQTIGKDSVLNLYKQNVTLTYQFDKCS